MKFAIISSTEDIASTNIKESLLKLFKFRETEEIFDNHKVYELDNIKLYTTDERPVYCEDIDKRIDADFFLFISKHSSASGIHSLSVHCLGNWGKAELGGKDNQLCISPALYLREGMLKLEELGENLDYEIIQEVTHHGPYLEKPVMFIEIGSNEEQWRNKQAADIIAKTSMHLLQNKPEKAKVVFGIGGLHHAPNFKKLYKQGIAVAHICPKYNLDNLSEEMIKQAIEKTTEKINLVLLDWKGMYDRDRILEILNKLNLNYKKTKEF
ncbi:D-tyrosyl-tRNA(Tyr) deacylase [Candidatus Woesearchaeota archaeon]|nr:D-tyrosyl-tRNA(Tyr) deacylase [Candidatus Woesearchaeota archaeon]